MKQILRFASIAMVLALTLAACGGSSSPSAAPATAAAAATTASSAAPAAGGYDEAAETKKLYDATVAAGETEINLYSSINEEEWKPLGDIWAKDFPKVKANFIRGSETALVSRVLTEGQAGKNNFDVLATTTSQLVVPAGLALKYFPPNASLIRDDLKDKAGYWFSIYSNWSVVQYNTNKVKKGDIKTYEDLLKPQFKGQIIIDSSDLDWYAGMINTMGQDKADALIRNIVKTNGVTLIDGHGTVNDKVTAGEFAVALSNYVNQPERSKRQGGPTDWVAIEPVTITSSGKVVVDSKAPHPNGAKLMAQFLAATDAQKYLASRGRQIARNDVPQDPPDLLKGITKTWVSPVLSPADNEALAKKYAAVFK